MDEVTRQDDVRPLMDAMAWFGYAMVVIMIGVTEYTSVLASSLMTLDGIKWYVESRAAVVFVTMISSVIPKILQVSNATSSTRSHTKRQRIRGLFVPGLLMLPMLLVLVRVVDSGWVGSALDYTLLGLGLLFGGHLARSWHLAGLQSKEDAAETPARSQGRVQP